MNDIKAWIREHRKERGLSQAALAVELGQPSYRVSQWERGVLKPEPAEMALLEQMFGTPGGADEAVESDRPSWWGEAIRLKDRMTLRELADHLGISVGMLTVEMKRAGVARRAQVAPPEPGVRETAKGRNGSKDGQIDQFFHLLGKVPDSEVARLAEVSVRTVASFRSRHEINGYKGPRRRPAPRGRRESKLEDFHHLLGHIPDRVVAEEAGMSLGAVRNYRIKHEIEPAGRMRKSEISRLLRELRQQHGDPNDGYDDDDQYEDGDEYEEGDDVEVAPAPAARETPAPRPEPRTARATAPAPTRRATYDAAPVTINASSLAWRVSFAPGSEGPVIIVATDLLSAVKRAVELVGGADQLIGGLEFLGKVISAEA
jgi:transcriptional regulator with XRE-family HTH domain